MPTRTLNPLELALLEQEGLPVTRRAPATRRAGPSFFETYHPETARANEAAAAIPLTREQQREQRILDRLDADQAAKHAGYRARQEALEDQKAAATMRGFETRRNVAPTAAPLGESPATASLMARRGMPEPDLEGELGPQFRQRNITRVSGAGPEAAALPPPRPIRRVTDAGGAFTDPDAAMGAEARARITPAVLAAEVGGSKRMVEVMGPDGKLRYVPESQAAGLTPGKAPRAVTGAERQSLSYFNRAKDASTTLATPDATGQSLEDRVAKSGLATQAGLQYLPNVLQTSDQQAYRQGQRSFTEARLRKESGAAIPTAEYENDAKTYFAQPGDTDEVIEQKRQAREVVLKGLQFASGQAYNEFYGGPEGGGGRGTTSAPSPPGPGPAAMVAMTNPAGDSYRVPADQVAEAKARGWK